VVARLTRKGRNASHQTLTLSSAPTHARSRRQVLGFSLPAGYPGPNKIALLKATHPVTQIPTNNPHTDSLANHNNPKEPKTTPKINQSGTMNRSVPTGSAKPPVVNHQGRQNSQPQFGPSLAHRNTRCPLNGPYAARGTMPAPPTRPRGPSSSPIIRSLPYNNTANGMRRESPPRGRLVMRQDDDWRTWQDLTVKLMRLPLGIMTLDVYRLCSTEGSIQKIDLQVGKADCSAFVEFQ